MILPLCMQKSHSHCCQTCSPKLRRMKWFAAPAPDTQTGVTRRHRPSKFCGEDQMHGKSAVYSRPGHSPTEWAICQSNTENPHNEPCGAGFAALGRSRLNCRKHNWTAPVELTACGRHHCASALAIRLHGMGDCTRHQCVVISVH